MKVTLTIDVEVDADYWVDYVALPTGYVEPLALQAAINGVRRSLPGLVSVRDAHDWRGGHG